MNLFIKRAESRTGSNRTAPAQMDDPVKALDRSHLPLAGIRRICRSSVGNRVDSTTVEPQVDFMTFEPHEVSYLDVGDSPLGDHSADVSDRDTEFEGQLIDAHHSDGAVAAHALSVLGRRCVLAYPPVSRYARNRI